MNVTPSTDLRRVDGVRLRLRLVEPGDAAYVHALRTNPAYNTHLSAVTGTADDQRAWIDSYKEREAAGREFYYVIERLGDGQPCGVVRLYDIETDRFSWGSWILDAKKPAKAALESAVLSFGIGFERLKKRVALIDVRRNNTRALLFYKRFKMRQTGEDARDFYFDYSAEQYAADKIHHLQTIAEATTA